MPSLSATPHNDQETPPLIGQGHITWRGPVRSKTTVYVPPLHSELSETGKDHVESAPDLIVGSGQVSDRWPLEQRGGNGRHLRSVENVGCLINRERRLQPSDRFSRLLKKSALGLVPGT